MLSTREITQKLNPHDEIHAELRYVKPSDFESNSQKEFLYQKLFTLYGEQRTMKICKYVHEKYPLSAPLGAVGYQELYHYWRWTYTILQEPHRMK